MPIQDIRNTVNSVEHAYATLELIDVEYEKRLSRWQSGVWLGLVAALAIPGPIGQTALCLSALAGMHWLRLVAQGAGRYWFMHQLALHDLLSPPGQIDWNFIASLLERIPKQPEASAAEEPPVDRVH